MLIALCIESATCLALIGALIYVLRQSARERRDLYTRIAAGSLQEYATLRPVVDAKPIPVEREREEPEELVTVPTVEVSGGGRSTYDSL